MGTVPVRIPEDSHRELKKMAASLNVPLSQAADLCLQEGFRHVNLDEHLELDADLSEEFTKSVPFDSETEAATVLNRLRQRQVDRNRERSDLEIEPAQDTA